MDAAPAGYWGRMREYVVSLLRAWFGDAVGLENEWGFGWLPRVDGDHSTYPVVLGMLDGRVQGFFLLGENPAVGSANSKLHRIAMSKLRWLVVRDLVEIESASFWKDGPEIASGELHPEEIPTEVFFLPAASHVEKDGSFTNTQRLLQWHHKHCPLEEIAAPISGSSTIWGWRSSGGLPALWSHVIGRSKP
jgi:formate dehydrogenase major subunit